MEFSKRKHKTDEKPILPFCYIPVLRFPTLLLRSKKGIPRCPGEKRTQHLPALQTGFSEIETPASGRG